MSKSNNDVPLTKDGLPDRRTKEGREAAAEEGSGSSNSGSKSPQRNLDGSVDKRTVEGRHQVAADNEKGGSKSSSSSSDKSSSEHHYDKSVPLTKDGLPDRRTKEGREAAEKEEKSSSQGSQGKSSSSSSHSGHSEEHEFDEGDKVIFNIGLNQLHGTIKRVITKDTEVDGRIAHGSKDEPRYAVEYEGTGTEQIRTEGALHKDEGYDKDAPLTKDGHPDRRTKEGKEAADNKSDSQSKSSSSSSSSDKSSSSSSSSSDVPLTKDGHPDRRTKEGREAAEKEEKDGKSSSSSSSRRDDRYRKGHKFSEGETVVFHVGKHELHSKIGKVGEHNNKDVPLTKDGHPDRRTKEGREAADKEGSEKESKDSKSSSGSGEQEHKFNEGDNVTFNIGLNQLHGTITKVLTHDGVVDGRVAHGSKDEPRYAVEYEGTGTEQIRTEGALKADDSKMDEDKNSSNKRKREDESKDSKDSKDSKSSSSKEPSPKKTKSSK